MELSPEERQRIYQEEKARLEAQEQLSKERKRKRTGMWFWVIGGIFVFFVVISFLGSQDQPKPLPSVPNQPQDDVSAFISKYGPPDREDSTEYDNPRPLIVTRFLIYDAERVQVVYVPDAEVNTPPPYQKWKLMVFQDSIDKHVLQPSEAIQRLRSRTRR